jgi:Spy/CpxP family protein refolding chaperone
MLDQQIRNICRHLNLVAKGSSIGFVRLRTSGRVQKGGDIFMKELRQLAVGLALALAISAPVIAQTATPQAGGARQGRGQGRGGARGASVATMPIGTLSYLVNLKDDQKTKITDIQTKLKDDVKGATGDRTKITELNTKARMDVEAILTDEQKNKLKELMPVVTLLQQSRAIPLAVIPDLKLTDEQKTKIKDAAKETQEKITAIPRAERQTGRPPLLADFKTKVEGILTDEQKKTIVEKAPKARPAP